MKRVVVIGAGLAGLTAALRLANGGAPVTLIGHGIGGLQLGQGTVDIYGYSAAGVVAEPLAAIAASGTAYTQIGAATETGVAFLTELVGPELLVGDPKRNVLLPTAVGAMRPTALYQPSMAAGVVQDGVKYLIVGINQFKDFYPQLVAENLARTPIPGGDFGGGKISARAIHLDFPARGQEADNNAMAYATAFDDPAMRQRFAKLLAAQVQPGEVIGLPAVLGFAANGWRMLAELVGAEIFEIPLAPPSIPGMRLDRKLTDLVRAAGIRVMRGSKVIGAQVADGRISSVIVGTAGRPTEIAVSAVVHAPGGFESGSLWLDSYGQVSEKVFDLPLANLPDNPFHGDYWGDPQPLFQVGLAVDDTMRPVDAARTVVYENLYAAGGILAGGTRWADKTGDGIALGSAVKAADTILGGM